MKRTELEKRERKLKQRQKKDDVLARKSDPKGRVSVNDYIEGLYSMLRHDYVQLLNAKENVEILELFEDMKASLTEKQWENVIKKAVKKTNVENKDQGITELKELLEQA